MEVVYYLGQAYRRMPDGTYKRVKRGRYLGSGRYGEQCLTMQVPMSLVPAVTAMLKERMAVVAQTRPSVMDPFFTTPGFDPSKINND